MNDDNRDMLGALIMIAILSLAFALIANCERCNADCVVAFYSPSCGPCMAQKPVEEKLIKEGYDIRLVNCAERPDLVAAYHVGRIPCIVYLAERPNGWFECDRRVGLQTEAQIRTFCLPRVLLRDNLPVINTVRAAFGLPVLLSY